MTFKKTEKEIIKAIVKYGGEVKSLAEVINKSQLLEDRGIVLLPNRNPNYIFLSKDKYNEDEKDALGYVNELISLIERLIKDRMIVVTPLQSSPVLVVGKEKSYFVKPGAISINDGKEFVVIKNDHWAEYLSSSGEQTHWMFTCSDDYMAIEKIMNSWYTVSEELKNLVYNDFKSEEQLHFEQQQRLTWVSIAVTGFIGLAGLIIALISLCN